MMALWADMKQWTILHLLLGYVFMGSGLIICFLMLVTYVCVWPFSKTLYRKIIYNLAWSHWSQLTVLAQWWSESDCVMYFEDVETEKRLGHEHTLIIMNHRDDLDWLMTWIISERLAFLGGAKVLAKRSLRYVPLIGWEWIFAEGIFLRREWDQDRKTISRDLTYLLEYPDNYWVTLLIFCEGTRFTKAKHEASMEFARKSGQPELRHHLLPRSKGFILTMTGLKGKINSVLDITIGFRPDSAKPTMMNVVHGKSVKAEMYIRRFDPDDIPMESDKATSAWLKKIYKEKDDIYETFVQNGHFPVGNKLSLPRRWHDLVNGVCWAVVLCVPLFYILASIFLSDAVYLQIIVILIFLLAAIGVRRMIGVTESSKGSAYGKVNASVQNGKKD